MTTKNKIQYVPKFAASQRASFGKNSPSRPFLESIFLNFLQTFSSPHPGAILKLRTINFSLYTHSILLRDKDGHKFSYKTKREKKKKWICEHGLTNIAKCRAAGSKGEFKRRKKSGMISALREKRWAYPFYFLQKTRTVSFAGTRILFLKWLEEPQEPLDLLIWTTERSKTVLDVVIIIHHSFIYSPWYHHLVFFGFLLHVFTYMLLSGGRFYIKNRKIDC